MARHALITLAVVFGFQTFFYASDFYFLYVVQKVIFPIVCFAYAIGVLFSQGVRGKVVSRYEIVIWLSSTYLVVVPALAALNEFGQPIEYGLGAEAKILSVFWFFLWVGFLRKLSVSPLEIEGSVVFTGVVLTLIYISANFLLDPQEYWTETSQLVTNDGKGYRFRFPVVILEICFFVLIRRIVDRFRVWEFVFACALIAYFLVFWKQRTELLCVIAVASVVLLGKSSNVVRIVFFVVGIAGFGYLISLEEYVSIFSGTDSSFLARAERLDIITTFLLKSPFNFLTGAGQLNQFWNDGADSVFGTYFSASDFGWLGVLYEFGFGGVVICLYFMYLLLRTSNRLVSKSDEKIFLAMRDFVWVTVLLSVIAPRLLYYPGIFGVLLATFTYYLRGYARAERSSLSNFKID